MKKVDAFTLKRICKFIVDFRERTAQLPTLKDLDAGGFDAATVAAAESAKKIEKFYVTLTNGSVVKGYKVKTSHARG
jgi:hypothetical protein